MPWQLWSERLGWVERCPPRSRSSLEPQSVTFFERRCRRMYVVRSRRGCVGRGGLGPGGLFCEKRRTDPGSGGSDPSPGSAGARGSGREALPFRRQEPHPDGRPPPGEPCRCFAVGRRLGLGQEGPWNPRGRVPSPRTPHGGQVGSEPRRFKRPGLMSPLGPLSGPGHREPRTQLGAAGGRMGPGAARSSVHRGDVDSGHAGATVVKLMCLEH